MRGKKCKKSLVDDAAAYFKQIQDNGGLVQNIKNWATHWLYGTDPAKLARMSKSGMVYNPPGHQ